MLDRLAQRLRAYAEKDGRGYPDWAVRYVPVVNRLAGCPGRVLEIGANEAGFARFSGTRTVVTDIAVDHLKAARATQDVLPVVADIRALPFPDRAFGACVCMDVFEHLDTDRRGSAAREIVRVLSPGGTGVVTFPSGAASEGAEARIRAAYDRMCGRKLKWLEEHVEAGLPDRAEIASMFSAQASAHRVRQDKNAPLWMWRCMWLILICGWPGRGNALVQAILRFFTPLLAKLHAGPCYRAVIWLEPKS